MPPIKLFHDVITFLGRESAQVLRQHPFIAVDANAIQCPVFVIGRKGHGNEKAPDLWNAMADYFKAPHRYISDTMGHGMFLQENWKEYAETILSWLR